MAERPSPGLVALTDQQDTAVQEVAKVIGSYYAALVAHGIPEENASELTHAYADTYWGLVWHRCCPCQVGPSLLD